MFAEKYVIECRKWYKVPMLKKSHSAVAAKWLLLAIVFTTGGSLLIIEILATRILAPYFGNTIFTFSSVISTVLAALSIGYYVGGKYADKHPTYRHFFGMILLSGLSVLLCQAVAITILPTWGYILSPLSGPLITSVFLFTVPSIFLGTLSPYAITLQRKNQADEGIGSLSGEVFFWSTLGSIAGSLSSGFFFIPHIGVRTTFTSVSLLLIAMGLIGIFVCEKKRGAKWMWLFIALLTMQFANVTIQDEELPEGTVFRTDGVYEQIMVYDNEYEGRSTRFLLQDRNLSSAEYKDGDGIVFDYVRHIALQKILAPDITRSLVIGAGAYTVPKILAESPENHVDTVDIEPELQEVAEQFFSLEVQPNMSNYLMDGRRFLYDSDTKYQFMFNDAYGSNLTIPSHLVTREFFLLNKEKLDEDGVIIANFIGSLATDTPSLLYSSMRTFRSVFPNSYFFATKNTETTEYQNVIFVAINNEKAWNPCDESLKSSEVEVLRTLCERRILISDENLAAHTIFTDDYVPADYYASVGIRKYY